MQQDNPLKVRLDKWLWAARFFKTRGQAKQAIEGGKVHYNGARSKVSKLVEVGAELKIRQGWDEKVVEVIALSDQRRGAPEAALLYRETEQSARQREENAARRRAERAATPFDSGRPTKRDRRRIDDFKHRSLD
ncbi:RNA-binding S4 domain-containing protein [Motiliproteus sediminis]|uniref:RNA-binding S4 domain-containing protein n=1 Tax=Motiliproteus sediminis TaxID=1468178 RepID=UPI001AEF955D|nr:S4 domain-containing protein [Motiliproteus sediminis]